MVKDSDDTKDSYLDGELSIDDVEIDEDYPPPEDVLADTMSILEKMREESRESQPPSSAPPDVEKIRRRRELLDTITDQLAETFEIGDEVDELRELNREIAVDFNERGVTESPSQE